MKRPVPRPAPAAAPGWLWLSLSLCSCDSELSTRAIPSARAPAFEIVATTPVAGATDVPLEAVVEVRFSNSLDRDGLGSDLALLAERVRLVAEDTGLAVAGAYRLESFERLDQVVRFEPADPLRAPAVRYRIEVSEELVDAEGRSIEPSSLQMPIVFSTVSDSAPPAPVAGFGLEPICAALRAFWDPAQDDFTPAEGIRYRVHVDPPPPSFGGQGFAEVRGATELLLTQLTPDTEYEVRVSALDAAGNESAASEPLRRAATLADAEAPVFDGARSFGRDPVGQSARTLVLEWPPAVDNCATTSVRYRIYLRECTAMREECERGITSAECAGAVADCGVAEARCVGIEETCAFSARECAVVTGSCETSAEAIAADPTRVITTAIGATRTVIDDLEPDTRYAALVRAVDTSDNEDANRVVVEAATRTGFQANVTRVIASAGCTNFGCHDAQTRSGCLVLESYEELLAGGCTTDPPTVTPGDPAGSNIIVRTSSENAFVRMPPCFAARLPLCPKQVTVLERWIAQGALDN